MITENDDHNQFHLKHLNSSTYEKQSNDLTPVTREELYQLKNKVLAILKGSDKLPEGSKNDLLGIGKTHYANSQYLNFYWLVLANLMVVGKDGSKNW